MTEFIEPGFFCFRRCPLIPWCECAVKRPRASSCVPLAGTGLHKHSTEQGTRGGAFGCVDNLRLLKSHQQQLWDTISKLKEVLDVKGSKIVKILFIGMSQPMHLSMQVPKTWHNEGVHHHEKLPSADVWIILETGAVLLWWFLLGPSMVLKRLSAIFLISAGRNRLEFGVKIERELTSF